MALFGFLLAKLLIPILRRSWSSGPSQPEILAEDGVAETLKGRPAQIDEYYRDRFNNSAQFDLNRKSRKKRQFHSLACHLPRLLRYRNGAC
jgi:hypothetical protein